MDTTNATIAIEAIEDNAKKVILKTAGSKYYFWKKKQSGEDTKAFQQFQKFKFSSGDMVDAAVKEQERTFTNEKGKEITYMDRSIAFFLVQDSVPQAPQSPRTSETAKNDVSPTSEHSVALKAYLQQLETRIRVIEDWKDKQPIYADIDGKQVPVPDCFDGEVRLEDLPM